jgi:NADH-quinone oxidoreductase subunit M
VVAAVQRGGPLWLTLGVLAAIGGALTAAYFLRLLRKVTHGPPGPAAQGLQPAIAGPEWFAWAPLTVLTLVVGLVPGLILSGTFDALTGALR